MSWCLRFLSKLGLQDTKSKNEALSFLLEQQNSVDGGFRTYASPSYVGQYMRLNGAISVDGWSSSQMCVTAVAVQALVENSSEKGVEYALEFIRENQSIEGYWNPYWWSGKLYATTHCMNALMLAGSEGDMALLDILFKVLSLT